MFAAISSRNRDQQIDEQSPRLERRSESEAQPDQTNVRCVGAVRKPTPPLRLEEPLDERRVPEDIDIAVQTELQFGNRERSE